MWRSEGHHQQAVTLHEGCAGGWGGRSGVGRHMGWRRAPPAGSGGSRRAGDVASLGYKNHWHTAFLCMHAHTAGQAALPMQTCNGSTNASRIEDANTDSATQMYPSLQAKLASLKAQLSHLQAQAESPGQGGGAPVSASVTQQEQGCERGDPAALLHRQVHATEVRSREQQGSL
jgi:hypothetical protein